MDAIPFIKEIVLKPALRVFLSDSDPIDMDSQVFSADVYDMQCLVYDLECKLRMKSVLMGEQTEDEKLKTIKSLQLVFRKFGISRRKISGRGYKKGSYWSSHRELRWLKTRLDSLVEELVSCNYLEHIEVEGELENKVDIDAVLNSLHDIKSMEDLFLANENTSNCFTNDEKSQALLCIKAFPALRELKDPNKMVWFLLELTTELDHLPEQIYKACEGQSQALLLIGNLLSCNPRVYDTWNRVKDDLQKIKMSNNYMWHIYTYCYDDLSYSLTPCFLYLACYPINYEIPARSLTEIWIAEDFVEPQDGETIEETANNYLEQLVQRSLVWVSKRSISRAIKCCRVRQSIHEFCIKKSYLEKFLVANPNEQEMESNTRVAFYNDDKKQYTEGEFEGQMWYVNVSSVVCFDFDMNVLAKKHFGKNL